MTTPPTAPTAEQAWDGDYDVELRGVLRLRLCGATDADLRAVQRQLGLMPRPAAGEADLVVRFCEDLPARGLTYVAVGESGFDADRFWLLGGEPGDGADVRTVASIPFDDLGERPVIHCVHGLPTVPHLLAVLNLTALSLGVLPLHSSAFLVEGRTVLVTGWAKSGKSEALLAAAGRGARYVGDEWLYIRPDGRMTGVPEPMRLWDWHLRQLPALWSTLPLAERGRVTAWRAAASLARRVVAARPNSLTAARAAPVLARQSYLRLPPSEVFGSVEEQPDGQLEDVVLLFSGTDDTITVATAEPGEVARRMAASLVDERAPLATVYRQFRYAFPDRVSGLMEGAEQLEADLLDRHFGNRPVAKVTHPYPCDIAALGDAVLRAARAGDAAMTATSARGRATKRALGPRALVRPHLTVALVGADGAGKSTISQSLVDSNRLPAPARRLYMGVNLEASSMVLPTTWLLLAVKRLRGRRPDLVASKLGGDSAVARSAATSHVKDALRMLLWTSEEWFRQGVAASLCARGFIVIFDRHFFADYHHTDVTGAGGRTLVGRAHGAMLRRLYPKPDLVVCLDAPGEVLYARKPEAGAAWLEQRRQQYLRLGDALEGFVVVDVDRPREAVMTDVTDAIVARWKEKWA